MSNFDDQIAFNIESEAKEAAKDELEWGELSEELRTFVREIAFGEEVSKREQVQRRLEELREQKDELRAKRRDLDVQLEEVETEITRLEERLDSLKSRDTKYEATLEMLEEALAEGQRVDPGHGQVIRAARIGETDPRGVIEDLRERNPSVPDYAFREAIHDDKTWTGFQENA